MPWAEEAGLPEEVREWDEVKNSENPEAFWKQMGDMRSHLGNSIRIPSKEAGEEDWKTFNAKLVERVPTLIPKPNPEDKEGMAALLRAMGHPEEASKYELPEAPEGTNMSEAESFRAIAHKYGLTNEQFKGIVSEVMQGNLARAEEDGKQHAQAMQTLRTDWGLKFDANMSKIKNLIKTTSGPEVLLGAIDEGRASVDTLIWLAEIADRFAETDPNLTKDKNNNVDSVLAPGEARKRLNEIYANRKHPYWDARHPGHDDAIAEVIRLQGFANPDASKSLDDLRIGARADRGSEF